ncbi:MAG: type II toxin-antitoxin system VapC family toxin [Pseudomonadales bacterium]
MILVDTSVWIDHLRRGDPMLVTLLERCEVLMHPMALGELACGGLRNRSEILHALANLPRIATATDEEVLYFIERRELFGRGIGYVDAHLLAAVSIASPARLWTRDRRLQSVADLLGVGYGASQ